jgi:hypothetical protein
MYDTRRNNIVLVERSVVKGLCTRTCAAVFVYLYKYVCRWIHVYNIIIDVQSRDVSRSMINAFYRFEFAIIKNVNNNNNYNLSTIMTANSDFHIINVYLYNNNTTHLSIYIYIHIKWFSVYKCAVFYKIFKKKKK